MLIFNSSSFEVRFDHRQGRFNLKCSSRLSLTEFQEGLQQALSFAQQHRVKSWLLDISSIGCLNEEEESWMQTHLFPLLMCAMGTNNYLALVLSEKCYQSLLLEAGRCGLKSYNSFIIINTFSALADAEVWLEDAAVCATSS